LDAGRSAIGRQNPRFLALENPEIVEWNILEKLCGRRMGDPVRNEQCITLGLAAVVEGEDELGALGTKAL
jgi:hypothetical protein